MFFVRENVTGNSSVRKTLGCPEARNPSVSMTWKGGVGRTRSTFCYTGGTGVARLCLLDCQWQMCLNCVTVERAPFCYTCCAGIARLCLLDCQWQMCLNCVTVR